LYYPLLRRVPVTHVAYFSVIPTTGTRYAPSGLRNRSDRRPSTSVYRKFIRSHRHSTACRFEEDRQPAASASSRRSQMKVTRYRVNNGSTCATNGAPAEIRLRKAAEQKERRHKRFFHREAAGAALVKMSLRIRVLPQFLAAIRHAREQPRHGRAARHQKGQRPRLTVAIFVLRCYFMSETSLSRYDGSRRRDLCVSDVLSCRRSMWESVRSKVSRFACPLPE